MRDFIKIAALVWVLLLFSVLSARFEPKDEYDKEREAAQEKQMQLYEEGISYAQNKILNHLDAVFMDLDFEIEDIYGISPEEALRLMEHYLDDEPVSEDDLANAIWAIRAYYYKSRDILDEVEEYWIE